MMTPSTEWLWAVFACQSLSSTQKLVGAVIAYSIDAGVAQIGHRQLGEACAVSHRSAMRAVRAMAALDWLVVRRVTGEANVYTLITPEPSQTAQIGGAA